MGVVEKGVEEADRDGLDVVALDEIHRVVHVLHVERDDHLALGVQPLADLEPQVTRHDHRRPVLEEVVELGARGTPQLEHVAESFGGDERCSRALVLEQRVGDDGRGMREEGDVAGPHAVRARGGGERVEDAAGEVARRGRHLDHLEAPARLVRHDDVREGAADVHADAPAHGRRRYALAPGALLGSAASAPSNASSVFAMSSSLCASDM
ncbi:MAG: hypothetical protein HW381_1755 [Candidatus Rokubacteria bacterium]|nr:hypothetical protein [Candidatus Rokubacteria bacterium]